MSGCPSSNIDVIILGRCSRHNYWLPTVTDIFLFGLVHFRLTDYIPFIFVPVILVFISVRLKM
jgi:hypothetical protein